MEVRRAYTTREVCELYNVHPNTVRAMVKDGRLKAGGTERGFRFSPEECDKVFLGTELKAAV